MKQYRVTSADFVPRGELGVPDAYIDSAEIAQLKKLSGLMVFEEYKAGEANADIHLPNSKDEAMPGIVGGGTNPSFNKRQIEKDNDIKVGTPEWFRLWFAKDYLTGEKPIGDAPAPKIKALHDKALEKDKKSID